MDPDHQRLAQTPFCFSGTVPQRDRADFHKKTIGYLFPVPISLLPGQGQEWFQQERGNYPHGALFALVFKRKLSPQDQDYLIERVEPESFLFIQIECLEVHDERGEGGDRVRKRIWRKQITPLGSSGRAELLSMEETEDDQPAKSPRTAIRFASNAIGVPTAELEVDDDHVRESLPSEVRVTLVAPLSGRVIVEPPQEGSRPQGRLFNGLPILSAFTGLSFHVDAPFNLDVERMDILEDEFNKWLIERVGDIIEEMVRELHHDPEYRTQIHLLVPVDAAYGLSRGIGAVTERLLRPVHTRLEALATSLGVLPALDKKAPMGPKEALALSERDSEPRVAAALQALLGGQPRAVFEGLSHDWTADTVRLCAAQPGTHLRRLLKKWAVPQVSPRWIETLLNEAKEVHKLDQRLTHWYRHLLIYVAYGDVEAGMGKLPDIAWIPSVCPQQLLAPREATILRDASLEELQLLGDVSPFAHPDFTRAYLDFQKELLVCHAQRLEALKLKVVTWRSLVKRTVERFRQAVQRPANAGRSPTPLAELHLLCLADQKKSAELSQFADLADLIYLSVTEPPSETTQVWRLSDLWLSREGDLLPVPRQVEALLPRVAPEVPDTLGPLWKRLSSTVPSPTLLEFVLSRVPHAQGETAEWTVKVWKRWRQDFKGKNAAAWTAAGRAVRCLCVPGKYTSTFSPLAHYFLRGFGDRLRDAEKGLTNLFGPRSPDLSNYGQRFNQEDYRLIQSEHGGAEEYVPTAINVGQAIKKLTTSPHSAAADLATDLATFLAQILEYSLPSAERQAMLEHLQSAWLPSPDGNEFLAPKAVFLLGERESSNLLAELLPLPAEPSTREKKDRLSKALRLLQQRRHLRFADPKGLTSEQKRKVVQRLSTWRPPNSPEEAKQPRLLLQLVGQLLADGWLEEGDLQLLRGRIELSTFHPDGVPGPDLSWVICRTNSQQRQLRECFPRGVITVVEEGAALCRGLCWAAEGFPFPPAAGTIDQKPAVLLEDPAFARRYLLARGKIVERLSDGEQANVLRAYKTLAQLSRSHPWELGAKEAVVLSEEGVLIPVQPFVFCGTDPEVRRVAGHLAPGRCLSRRVIDLPPNEREGILKGLGLHGDEYTSSATWLQVRIVPDPNHQSVSFSDADRDFLPQAIRDLCRMTAAAGNVPVDFRNCPVRLAKQIIKELHLLPVGQTHSEELDRWLQPTPQTLFLTANGLTELKLEILKRRNVREAAEVLRAREEFREREKQFRTELEEPKNRIQILSFAQKDALLGYYRISVDDPAFFDGDASLSQRRQGIDERWKEFLRDPLRIRRLIKKHTQDVGYGKETVIRELLQNIDDSYHGVHLDGTAWVEFRLEKTRLIVRHEGRRFNQASASGPRDDLLRICGLGGSQKKGEIGRFGLGFKSVLAITSEPVVLSHPYYFRIRHIVVPEWEDPEKHLSAEWQTWVNNLRETRFILESSAKEEPALKEVAERLRHGWDGGPRSLLFLRNLKKMVVHNANVERTVVRTDQEVTAGLAPKPALANLVSTQIRRLTVEEAGRAPKTEAFLVLTCRAPVAVPTETGDKEEMLEYAVAFPWNLGETEQCFGSLDKGEGVLYLFLSTRQRTGLPFFVHGEFLTNLGRTDIDGQQPCNKALAEKIAELVRETLKSAFTLWQTDPKRARSIYNIVPLPLEMWVSDWLDGIRNVFANLLAEARTPTALILTTQGKLARASDCVLGARLVHQVHKRLLQTEPAWSGKALVADGVSDVIEQAQARRSEKPVKSITGPMFAELLFPAGLQPEVAIRRCRMILGVLSEQAEDVDSTRRTEKQQLLDRLSDVPCFPDRAGRIGRPIELQRPDWQAHYPPGGRVAHLDAIAGQNLNRSWILAALDWMPLPSAPEPEGPRLAQIDCRGAAHRQRSGEIVGTQPEVHGQMVEEIVAGRPGRHRGAVHAHEPFSLAAPWASRWDTGEAERFIMPRSPRRPSGPQGNLVPRAVSGQRQSVGSPT